MISEAELQTEESIGASFGAKRTRRFDEVVSKHPPLKVLLDGRKLGGGGIGVYIDNLVSGLLALGEVKLSLIVNSESKDLTTGYGDIEIIEDKAKLYSIDELVRLPKRVDFEKYDLFHSPHFTLPFGVSIPTVVTIHDIIHITHPERFFYPWIAKPLIRSSMKRATRVLAVSNATRGELERLTPKLKEKMSVVPNALDPFYLIESSMRDDSIDQTLRGKYLIATFSNVKPHKAVEDLLWAFGELKRPGFVTDAALSRFLEGLELVLVGMGTEELRGSNNLPPGVRIEGRVTTQKLHSLYSRAVALVVPSIAEGFCLPVIEAQACGTPAIVRPVPAVLELMTTNDFVCRDMSKKALSEGILELLKKRADEQEDDFGVPLEHMKRFCREDVSRAVLTVYHQAVHDFQKQ